MKRTASVALLLLVALCGCGSNGSGSDGDDKPTSGSASPTAGGGGATTTTTADDTEASSGSGSGSADGKNPVDGAQFCAFLTKLEPRLKSDGSAPGAEADFAIELATWIGDHPEQKPRTGKDLDDASQQSCPTVRTAAVADMGATSFQDAVG